MKNVLVIDDDQAILNFIRIFLLQTGEFEPTLLQDSTRACEVLAGGNYDVLLLDMDMPNVTGMDVLKYIDEQQIPIVTIVLTGVEDIDMAISAMKLGTTDYMLKPIDEEKLLDTLKAAINKNQLIHAETEPHKPFTLDHLKYKETFAGIITQDEQMLKIFHFVEKFSTTDNSVLIWGESGTGKELIARAIHDISNRNAKNFVAVNAGAFANELFASEFFGHDKGSFTGAITDKKGFIEEAEGGTLFLDEIGELTLPIQVKLLRVLQEEEFYRLGSTKNRKANVRIIAATNKNLFEEIQKGNFRKDLFFRLNINSINLPALRDRKGDVELLAYHFLKEYGFPGNVRELMNMINSAIIVESGQELQRNSLPHYFLESTRGQPLEDLYGGPALLSLEEVEKRHIRKILSHTRMNKTKAAKLLGISRVNLIAKIKKYRLE
jgi:DNA-binding NtrC family response regulator